MLFPKNVSKENTLESHIIHLFPRECLHFSGEIDCVYRRESTIMTRTSVSQSDGGSRHTSFVGVGQVTAEWGNTIKWFSEAFPLLLTWSKENHKHF